MARLGCVCHAEHSFLGSFGNPMEDIHIANFHARIKGRLKQLRAIDYVIVSGQQKE